MSGPLPDPNRRRRNAPTIPTTDLPISGRQRPAPKVPKWCELGAAGAAWWKWAWAQPEAAAWPPGTVAFVARRASLEDDLLALEGVGGLELDDIVSPENLSTVRLTIVRLTALCTGRLQVLREMREGDDRLGLTPKGFAANRYRLVPDPVPVDDGAETGSPVVSSLAARRARLTSAS